ncbi:MAG TPA: class I SAM-dependent methyltransferase [Longimicrobium sp.]|nr:class I SAM-dependent methyltransferase [Longimicrobium sp.]
MYHEQAALYDRFYAFKDYDAEAARVRELVVAGGGPGGGALLDAACGTGGHVGAFRAFYTVEGLDLAEPMLAVAREKHPDVPFHAGDLRSFDLGRRFDVVTCLFSSIGYMRTEDDLRAAAANFARHLRPGGALVVEPWMTPDVFRPGNLDLLTLDEPALKAARMARSRVEPGPVPLSVIDYHFLVGHEGEIRHTVETETMGLFTRAQMEAALEAAGVRAEHQAEGLMGRGLYVGVAA